MVSSDTGTPRPDTGRGSRGQALGKERKTTMKDTRAYFEFLRAMQERDQSGDYRQWIADVYHCSECWGQKMTDEEMLLDLAESRRQADPDDYVPDITLYKECAAYWNVLCDAYPN